jgi:RNA polymerase sigma-70 factor (ECF subfamily)
MATPISPTLARARAEFENLIKDVRPDLHRYVAHMIGSVVDAEDVVQEALAKAYYSLTETISGSNLRGWLFHIAHNKAIDHLRRYDNKNMEQLDEQLLIAEPDLPLEERELVAIRLKWFEAQKLIRSSTAERTAQLLMSLAHDWGRDWARGYSRTSRSSRKRLNELEGMAEIIWRGIAPLKPARASKHK